MLVLFVDWLEQHQLPCYYHKYLGFECPGCGMQTSIISLLKGDILGSIQAYPALFPIFLMLAYLIVHLFFKFEKGGSVLKVMFIFNAAIIVLNYIYKQII